MGKGIFSEALQFVISTQFWRMRIRQLKGMSASLLAIIHRCEVSCDLTLKISDFRLARNNPDLFVFGLDIRIDLRTVLYKSYSFQFYRSGQIPEQQQPKI